MKSIDIKKPLTILADEGAFKVNIKELNMTSMSLQQITVPFHNAELFLVEHNGQPYTPMKPVVEGMGLAWQSQLAKLNANPKRWGVTKIVIPTLGDLQEMVCLPLRKLLAWLTTISPNKVKPELRDTVIMYQNECDDVLWDYWTKGHAINQRAAITPEQQALLHEIVDRRSKGERQAYAEMWSRHNRHFKIPRYAELLTVHFPDSVHYLETMELKTKFEKPQETDTLEKLQSFVENLAHRYPTLQNPIAHEIAVKFGDFLKYQNTDDERLVYHVLISKGKVSVMPETVHHTSVDIVKLADAFKPLHDYMMGYEISRQAEHLRKLELKTVPR
jgi:hypothetical protein